MRRAVSISLGSPSRDKIVDVTLNGVAIRLQRIGTGGDAAAARRLFAALDGRVDALSVGGTVLYVPLDGREYPIRAVRKRVQDVTRTPVVGGGRLKYALEVRFFERAAPLLGGRPHFRQAFVPFGADRLGLLTALSEVTDDVLIGDLMFIFGVPYALHGVARFKRLLRVGLPLVGYLPMAMLYAPGAKHETPRPKYVRYWNDADLIGGDMHDIRQYAPPNLAGKVVITNTTTESDIALLRARGVHTVLTTTPRYDGRSFGVNAIEALLTAYAGKGRRLTMQELDTLIDELDLRPTLQTLNAETVATWPTSRTPSNSDALPVAPNPVGPTRADAPMACVRACGSHFSIARSIARSSRYTACAASKYGVDGFSRTDRSPSPCGTTIAIIQ